METSAQHAPADLDADIARTEGFLKIDPGNRHLLAHIVDLQLRRGDTASARLWAQHALVAHPDDPQLVFRYAGAAIAADALDEAREALLSLQDAAEREPAIGFQLAYCDFREGRYEDALAVVARYPAMRAAVAEAPVLEARCLHQLGDVGGALAVLAPRLAAGAADGEACGLAALLEFDNGRLEQAGLHARAALSLAADNVDALVVLGSLALEERDMAVAESYYAQARAVAPETGRAWLGSALVAMHGRQFTHAVPHFERACALMPAHAGTRIALAWCRVALQDLAGAETDFERALELDRTFAESHGGLAAVSAMLGKAEQARRHATRALRLNPACVAAQYAEGVLSGAVRDERSLQDFVLRTLGPQAAAARVAIH